MKEGAILLSFIENQRKSKTSIAEDLGMSRRNLYQLFESQTLSPDTKAKFESYFKEEIFSQAAIEKAGKERFYKAAELLHDNTHGNTQQEIIQLLKDKVTLLEEKNRSLEKEVLRNLMMNQEFLKGMMAQIRAASRLAAEFYAAGNKKKLDESLNTLDKYVSVFREEMK